MMSVCVYKRIKLYINKCVCVCVCVRTYACPLF